MKTKPWPHDPRYHLSDNGSVISHTGYVLGQRLDTKGRYLVATVRNPTTGQYRNRAVHVMVCEAFHGPRPPGDVHASHANGNPVDNRAANLRWKTRAENEADKIEHGTYQTGERNHEHVLTEAQVQAIRAQYRSGALQREIAAAYGVGRMTITDVINRRTWKHVA